MKKQVLVYDGFQRCPYLDGEIARMPLYRQLDRIDLDGADLRFESAERRVGRSLYRTACPTCTACQGIRILVDDFEPSRSQRRVLRRWQELGDRVRVSLGRATWSEEKLGLFNRHKAERGLSDSTEAAMDAVGYVGWLVQSCFHTVEMRYELDGELIGVGIVDLGRRSMSSVYFYFDPRPEISALSPGVYSVLREIELGLQTGRKHHYLGLYVGGCGRLAYKATYLPHERLEGGVWRRYDRGGLSREP